MSSRAFLPALLVLALFGVASSQPTAPGSHEWHFVVSGDSRNCGDLVMPAIAQGAARDGAAFYWHLGDFRAIYEYDEDVSTRRAQDFGAYIKGAWNDFLEMQVAPFEAARIPVFLGIGNHETIPPKTRAEYVKVFEKWLDSPTLRAQRRADHLSVEKNATYYHWVNDGVDFINLDNASADQFDTAQMKWFNTVLKRDNADAGIRTIVVGMHKALPGSLGSSHSMNDSPQGLYSGRCVYKSLSSASVREHKQVYVLASHSHFYMDNVYDTDFWRQHAASVLPGWIVGTAGAVRYRLPPGAPPSSQADMYGYLLATVNAGGTPGAIRFDFKPISTAEDIPAETLNKFSPELAHFCFNDNKDLTEPRPSPEPPDSVCPESD